MELINSEKRKATSVSKRSGDTNSWRYPENRRQAISLLDEGVRVSITKNLAGNLVNFLQSIGADNELPDDHGPQVEYLNHFHNQLAVNNPIWPEDMSFEFVYAHFVNALMYNRVELRGHNIHAFITAFKNWITQQGVEDLLREKWNRNNPAPEPEKLQPAYEGTQDEIDMNRLIEGKKVHEWPDQVIADQYEEIQLLYDEGMIDLLNAKYYATQVVKEAKKRGLV